MSSKESTQLTWVETLMRWCGAGVDIEDIKNAAACGAQVVQCNLDAWAWKTPLSDQGGVLGGDPFADFVKVCQLYNVKALAYVGGFTKITDPDFVKQHEDWLRIDAEGRRSTQGWMCYNTPFGDFLIQRCAELVKRYELVGLWIDGYNPLFTPCYCPHCKAAYAKASGGGEIPRKFDPADMNAVRYVRWHIENLNDFSSRLCKAVREARPGAVVLANFAATREWARKTPWPLWDSTTGLRRVHAPSLELWWENPGDAVHQSFAIQSLRAGAGEGPTEVWMVTRPRGVDSTALTRVELLCRMFSVIANGSWPDIVADPGDLARSKLCFDEMRPRVPWMI
ncbi:MAG TPA: hypothetical protein VNJ09_10825, partial [Chthonomonadales bacterium]|nr:hypothetical protein [Chthonomonadales bacterium]